MIIEGLCNGGVHVTLTSDIKVFVRLGHKQTRSAVVDLSLVRTVVDVPSADRFSEFCRP